MPDEFPRPQTSNTVTVDANDLPGPRTPFAVRDGLEPNTRYHVEGRGDFYTNAQGKVEYVETSYGGRGNLNPDLQNLQPNAIYVVHPDIPNPIDGVSHAHLFRTDELGGVDMIHTDALARGNADRSAWTQSQVGALGGDGVEGAHMLANFAGGGSEYVNLAPMITALNRGSGDSYFNLEGLWRRTLTTSPDTVIPVTIWKISDGSPVPVRFDVEYRIGDGPIVSKEFWNG
jgi:hypothetical protein